MSHLLCLRLITNSEERQDDLDSALEEYLEGELVDYRIEPRQDGFEHILWLSPQRQHDPEAGVAHQAGLLGDDWTFGGDGYTSYAVWSAGKGSLRLPDVTFANLEVSEGDSIPGADFEPDEEL
ncbi:MAG: hypothetical protein KC910_32865 [Candidatus Eremiobacteraeota bacterium]|nr:hypothetical protein [Candidatus Eremiobacteraeota bacterium]